MTILNVHGSEAPRCARTTPLRQARYKVREAATGREALRLAEAKRPQLVLLDLKLPDMSGPELCNAMKALHPNTLVLVVSSRHNSTEDRIVAFENGADGCLMDSVEPKELVASVRALLRLRSAERRQKILSQELLHRSRNLLAVIRSLANNTLVGREPLAVEKNTFLRRLSALTRSQEILGGIHRTSSLAALIRAELQDYMHRVDMSGPGLVLEGEEAQNLSLLIHELSTNAQKYGSLSVPTGTVEIRWTVSRNEVGEARLNLHWKEHGGPPISEPSQKGFGSVLIEALTSGAPSQMDFAPEGLRCEFDLLLISETAKLAGSGLVRQTSLDLLEYLE